MQSFAASFYLLSTALFACVSLAVGVRLLALSRRTRGAPEGALGLGVMLTAGLGYPILIAAALLRSQPTAATSPLLTALGLGGYVLHHCGVFCVLWFVVIVFRPDARWARCLLGLLMLLLWTGLAGYTLGGGLAEGRAGGFFFWLQLSVISTYAIWPAIEAFRYYALMRRRRAIGLAEPLVVNRFLLWGLAASFTVAAVWAVNLPVVLGRPMSADSDDSFGAVMLTVTAAIGLAAVTSYWLTFFPPRWYRARIG